MNRRNHGGTAPSFSGICERPARLEQISRGAVFAFSRAYEESSSRLMNPRAPKPRWKRFSASFRPDSPMCTCCTSTNGPRGCPCPSRLLKDRACRRQYFVRARRGPPARRGAGVPRRGSIGGREFSGQDGDATRVMRVMRFSTARRAGILTSSCSAPTARADWIAFLLGSVSENVMRHATCSVEVVRAAAPEKAD